MIFVFLRQIILMKSLLFKYRKFIAGFLVFSAIVLSLFYSALKPSKSLPIYNPADVNPELVDSTVQYIANKHHIADFSFTNQNGKTITQKIMKAKFMLPIFSLPLAVLFVQK